MKLKRLIFFVLLLMSWTQVTAQRYVIGSDTLHCFTTEQVQKQYTILEDLNNCELNMIGAWETERHYVKWVEKLQADSLNLAQIVSVKDDLLSVKLEHISFLEKSLKREKRRHTVTKLTSVGVFIAGLVLVLR